MWIQECGVENAVAPESFTDTLRGFFAGYVKTAHGELNYFFAV